MLQNTPHQKLVDYLTVGEAAAFLGVSPWTLRNWDKSGKLRPQRHPKNGYRIYRHADLEAVLEIKSGESAPAAQHRWSDVGECEHFVQFYEDDDFLIDCVADFISESLNANDAGIIVADNRHSRGIQKRMKGRGIDVSAALKNGQLIVLDARETLTRLMVGDSVDPARFMDIVGGTVKRLTIGGRRLRAFGEMVALLWKSGNRSAAIELEQLWNQLGKSERFALLCAYPMSGFAGEEQDEPFCGVCSQHTRVIPAESYSTLKDDDQRLRAISALQQRAQSLEAEIAHRQQVEKELSRRERELRDFFENAIEGLHRVGPDGTILWANRAEMELLGYEPQEYIGGNITAFHADQDIIEDMLAKLQRGEALRNYPARMRCKNGAIKHVLVNSNAHFEDGKFVCTRCFTRDVTERHRAEEALRQSEARLRAILQTTPECVKIVAGDGSLLYINAAGLGMIECAQLADAQGRCVFNFVPEANREAWRRNHERVCGGERLSWEFELIGTKGTRRWLETHGVPLPMPDGATAHLAVTRDITARKQSEVERNNLLEAERAARSDAERASRMKDEFLATLSHELRTPLNAILGWATILRSDDISPEDLQQSVETIERNARAQTRIIEDLLDMSRIISGKVRLDVQRIDLPQVVRAALETAKPAADNKRIRLTTPPDSAFPAVLGDVNRLQQVMWNLLSNAIKFTPPGGQVAVTLARAGTQLELSVSDSGEGIPREFLPYVFDRFRQADASTTRRHGGLGIGLAITKHLVELHGGSIRAESGGSGQGSTFTITLPVNQSRHHEPVTAEQSASSVTMASEAPDMRARIAGVKVLVVDDEPDNRELVRRLLADCDALVTTASSAAEAFDAALNDPPDVIISDIGMPGEDGYAFLRRIRSLDTQPLSNVPAIALTAYARSQDRMQSVLAGYQMHIPKPVEPAELITMVASLAGRAGA